MYVLSRKSVSENQRLYDEINHPKRKVIVATNVAETGATFEHVSYVVDSMKFINVAYNPVTKAHTIATLPICKNMSQQRKGRVGRTSAGVYLPAIARQDHDLLLDRRETMTQI